MGRIEYTRERRRLLQAAAWHAYVARRGLNWRDGQRRRRENQRQLAELRRQREGRS